MKNSKTTLLAIIAGGVVAGISAVAGIFSERKNNARKEAEAEFDDKIEDEELKELINEEEPEPTFTEDTPEEE